MDTEREQVEQVFGLTGGELNDAPWIATDAEGREWTFHHHYDFPPEYAEKELDYTAHTYRTVVRDNMFGEPPEQLQGWDRVAIFQSSGETECPMPNYANGDADERPCPLCDAQTGEDHGYIYIGDGWAEVVYRQHEDAEVSA